ncbi:MAG: hypothetical protein GY868_11295 [Deltaproteobacteria bacterium]|nr:hypothetical protein [Deltaproteobacteria bacterium]
MGLDIATDLTLLLKYLSGRLPVLDFEIDFNKKGTALNMLNSLFECLGDAINCLARPVDAIKHQAKTVTVGTSRITAKVEGLLFDTLAQNDLDISQLTASNVLVLKNLQNIVAKIKGATLYSISGLTILGEPTETTTIEVKHKNGSSVEIISRADTTTPLLGTKRIIAREGNVYIGQGRKDKRSIIVIPALASKSGSANMVEHLLLLHIKLQETISLEAKKKALGGKYERIKNIIQESSVTWNDGLLDRIDVHDLFGRSAEKVADMIMAES